jgi:predicted AlkP superfamily pyrophosphatase or phosphodiesterase
MRYAALGLLCSILAGFSGCSKSEASPPPAAPTAPPPAASGGEVVFERAPVPRYRVIVLVWDGLRPDSIDPTLTPELARLRDQRGTNFRNHHSVYPTFTMMNAAAFATGTLSGTHGFYGNYEYQPGPTGKNAKGADVDYSQPFFSEDHAILQALDAFYRASGSSLLRVQTLFEAAHASGLKTAAIGKTGPAFLQDYRATSDKGVILDENVVLPRSFAVALQEAGFPLPKNTVNQAYPEGPLVLEADNGDPTAATDPTLVTLADGVTPDPRAASGSPHKARNAYLMRVFTDYVIPMIDPALSVVWLRNPDSTEHAYGPGSPNVRDALEHQDILLGELLSTLDRLGRTENTDLIVVSDHGHSTVASDPKVFSLRELTGAPDGHGKVGAVNDPGYVVSGDIRTADWLRRAGFSHVYDGAGCVYDPVLAGMNARGQVFHPTYEDAGCGTKPKASTRNYKVPAGELPGDAIVAAANGGSEYFYVPSHDPQLVQKLVKALQERAPFGPLFVRSLYGALPGTLPLTRIGMEGPNSVSPPMPDVVVSFDWDDTALNAASVRAPGSEHSSPQGHRGMHGSFSPIDVRNVLVASGPSFRKGFVNDYPSNSLDLAPTVATLLGLSMPHAEGRVLDEALVTKTVEYEVEPFEEQVGPVPIERMCKLDDPDCRRPVRGLEYRWTLNGQTLTTPDGARRWVYLDRAKVERLPAKPAK